MADRPRGPRVIPNFAMDRPWSDPQTEADLEGLAQTAILSGVQPTNRSIATFIQGLSNAQYTRLVAEANGQTQ